MKDNNVYKTLYTSYRIHDFLYYIESYYSDYFLVFKDCKHFTFFDGLAEDTVEDLEVETQSLWPFKLVKEKIGSRVVLYNTSEYFYLYNINKKLLQKIE